MRDTGLCQFPLLIGLEYSVHSQTSRHLSFLNGQVKTTKASPRLENCKRQQYNQLQSSRASLIYNEIMSYVQK